MVGKLKCAVWIAASLGTAVWSGLRASAAESPPATQEPLFERLVNEARDSAKKEYKAPAARLPDHLKSLGYDAYMGIHFRREKSLWHGVPGRFEVQFLHPGYLYQEPVRIHVVEEGTEREVQFSPDMFDYGEHRVPEPLPRDLFLTGLRVLYPLNRPSKMDEVAVFLGSSYFRVLGAHQVFGSSIRGLAIDTAEPGGEEFPRFVAFWIEKPGPLADQIRLLARLESRRVSGAYQFLIKPGVTTVVEIEASLFLRDEVKKLGLGPLTSMFLFGENRTHYYPDFRPEVHDADGLLVETPKSAWQWRPLVNPPKAHQITAFPNAVGFGLMQRDRNGDHYQDLEAHFERRPGYWITPEGDWGAGRVELVEIPSTEERNDNIVAYWVPEGKVPPGQEFRFRYRLLAFQSDITKPREPLLRVLDTRLQPGKDGRTRFLVDFSDDSLAAFARPAPVAKAQTSSGKLEGMVTQPNELLGGWRTFFDLVHEGDKSADLRVWLEQGDEVISETWVYHFIRP
jgi:glucans biosynthesis protein